MKLLFLFLFTAAALAQVAIRDARITTETNVGYYFQCTVTGLKTNHDYLLSGSPDGGASWYFRDRIHSNHPACWQIRVPTLPPSPFSVAETFLIIDETTRAILLTNKWK